MTLSRANVGFTGGTVVDLHPDVSIEECMQSVSYECNVAISEYAERYNKLNDDVLKMMVESVQYGNACDIDKTINEANETIQQKASNLWERIKSWFTSIVSKISTYLVNGKSRQKYVAEHESEFNSANLDGKEINGYPFIGIMSGKSGIDLKSMSGALTYDKLKSIANINPNSDTNTIRINIGAYFGKNLSSLGFGSEPATKEKLREKLYGAKTKDKIKLSDFDKSKVLACLKNVTLIKETQELYKGLTRTVEEAIRNTKTSEKSAIKDAKANGEKIDKSAPKESALMQTALSEFNNLLSAIFKYAQDENSQAWSIFTKALGKTKSDNNTKPTEDTDNGADAEVNEASHVDIDRIDELCNPIDESVIGKLLQSEVDELYSDMNEAVNLVTDILNQISYQYRNAQNPRVKPKLLEEASTRKAQIKALNANIKFIESKLASDEFDFEV